MTPCLDARNHTRPNAPLPAPTLPAARSTFPYNSLVPEAAALLLHWRWHRSMLPALRRWVRCAAGSPRTGVELLEAIMAGAPCMPG